MFLKKKEKIKEEENIIQEKIGEKEAGEIGKNQSDVLEVSEINTSVQEEIKEEIKQENEILEEKNDIDPSKISISQIKKDNKEKEFQEAQEINLLEEEKVKQNHIGISGFNKLALKEEGEEESDNISGNKEIKKTKTIKKEEVKDFHDAINAIKIYIFTEDWENGHKAIEEIKIKEKEALDLFFKTIEDPNKKIIEKKKYEKNILTINKVEVDLKEKEQKYNERIAAEKFKLKFKKIKEEINILSKTHRHQEALSLLGNFLEDNKEKYFVIQFYNKEKKAIQKGMEKERVKQALKERKDVKDEAMRLIGQTMTENDGSGEKEEKIGEEKNKTSKLNMLFNFYKIILEKRRKKKLIDEVTSLIESQNQAEIEIAKSKLEKVHQGLIKELSVSNIRGYEFFGKILGADKISGDTFGFIDDKNKYNFFLGDATGHGVRAGLIVSLLSRLFNKYAFGTNLKKLIFEINNGLKQDLQSKNFITGIFFEIEKENPQMIKYVGMGHEPMFIYRAKEKKVERLIPGGLASGIRIIKQEEDVKVKDIELEDTDILICFSDGVIEARDIDGKLYGIDKLEACIQKYAQGSNITKLYNAIIDDVKFFKGGSKFDDDATIIFLKREEKKDIIQEKDIFLQEVAVKEGLTKQVIKKMVGKTKEQLKEEIQKIKKEKELLVIIKILEGYYYTGEIIMLKQEAIRFIKEGFIHPKINKYLKLAIANETKYKIDQKNKRIESKYNVLKELMKKGDYATVIKECNEIIAKDGNI